MRYSYIFRLNFFVLYNRLRKAKIEKEVELYCLSFCRNSYKEVLRLQIFMADNKIPFTYTDTISLSELNFLYTTLCDYLDEKNSSLEKLTENAN